MIVGVGIVLVSPQDHIITKAFSLTDPYSINVAKYNALLIGMQLAREIDIHHLEAYGNSKLIINQIRGEYEVRHEGLMLYHHATPKIAQKFTCFYIEHIRCGQNTHADALASLVAALALLVGTIEEVCVFSRDSYCSRKTL